MAAYLEACMEEANGDATFVAKALGDIARAKVWHRWRVTQVFLGEPLQGFVGDRSPGFDTILKVVDALGLKLHARAAGTR